MSTDPVSTLAQQLCQSQLLDAAQLDELERLKSTATRPAQLASELVRRGWITSHQANQVAMGRAASLVIGSYIVLEPIGGGGMGQVVKARHRFMNRNVALKLIRQDQRESADIIERFQRETRLLAELRHPHIVQAFDAGLAGDVWFLAMELLEGTDLAVLVQQRGRLPVGVACEYIRQAALGLQHAHQRGLVHRDIKPSNLFLTAEGIKVLDLGLARPQASDAHGALTQTDSVMGTPDYLAPEQAVDPRKAGTRSDLYSLGCTLYFLLSGRPPFPEGTLTQKLLSHQQAEPEPIEKLSVGVPPAVSALLRRMLAKRPEDRPANAAEVANLLGPPAAAAPAFPIPTVAPSSAAHGKQVLRDQTVMPHGSPLTSVETGASSAQRAEILAGETISATGTPSATATPSAGSPSHSLNWPVLIRRYRRGIGAAAGGILLLLFAIVFWPWKGSGSDPNSVPDRFSFVDPANPKSPSDAAARSEGWTVTGTVKLPGMAGKLAVGGGGRYLILEIPLKRILVIFDVAKGKLTHEIPGDDVILFAAGAKHVVVLHPIDEKIRFFGLSDGKEDRSVPLPKELVGKEINQACMASAKEGPLFVYLPKEFRTHSLNLQTMSVTEIPWSNWGPHKGPGPNNIRTTPDGSVLAGFGANTERLTMKDGKPYGQGVFMSSSHSPGSLSTDGKWIYTNWAIYAANGVGAKIPDHDKAYFVAPHEPGYFLVLFRSERQMYKRDGQVYPDAMQDPIVFSDSRQRLFVIPDCDEFRKPNKLSWEQRIHYYPRAGVLVTISGDADELILHTAGPNK